MFKAYHLLDEVYLLFVKQSTLIICWNKNLNKWKVLAKCFC